MERPSIRKVKRVRHNESRGDEPVPVGELSHSYYLLSPRETATRLLDVNDFIEVAGGIERVGSSRKSHLTYRETRVQLTPCKHGAITELLVLQSIVRSSDESYRLGDEAAYQKFLGFVEEALATFRIAPPAAPPDISAEDARIYYRRTNEETRELLATIGAWLELRPSQDQPKYYGDRPNPFYGVTALVRFFDAFVALKPAGREKNLTQADYYDRRDRATDPAWLLEFRRLADSVLKEYEVQP